MVFYLFKDFNLEFIFFYINGEGIDKVATTSVSGDGYRKEGTLDIWVRHYYLSISYYSYLPNHMFLFSSLKVKIFSQSITVQQLFIQYFGNFCGLQPQTVSLQLSVGAPSDIESEPTKVTCSFFFAVTPHSRPLLCRGETWVGSVWTAAVSWHKMFAWVVRTHRALRFVYWLYNCRVIKCSTYLCLYVCMYVPDADRIAATISRSPFRNLRECLDRQGDRV